MPMENRPNPDELLKVANAEEAATARGHLKIFFGACAGVGKTYAMLEAAHERQGEGWDIVVGLVETHGRLETAALLEGFEILPRREVPYKGVVLKEFDLDAAIARRPRLILVDELAHTNVEGSRHTKRWQDVEELLNAGIDVYTTLNVQHWESLNDVVAQITGIQVHETVPDTFLERIQELELVDISPEDLLKRLKDGKVYHGEMATRAADHFFQTGNLIALRELSLRHTAERVDAQMQAFKTEHAIGVTWPAGECLLIGVTSSPTSTKLVRATARLAAQLHARWIAVHVETPTTMALSSEGRARLIDNLRLAESLGAEPVTLTGQNIVDEVLSFAHARNVTKIVMGKPATPRWKEWVYGSIIDNISRRCGDIDVYVISGVEAEPQIHRAPQTSDDIPWAGIAWGAITTAACTLLCWPLFDVLRHSNLMMIYLLGIAWVAYRFGRIPSLVTSTLSVLCFDFFFVPPYFSFSVASRQDVLAFGVMFVVGVMIGTLTSRLRKQTNEMRRREQRVRMLYGFGRDLLQAKNSKELLHRATERLQTFYKVPVVLIAPGHHHNHQHHHLEVAAGNAVAFLFDDHEKGVAQWVFDHAQMAGIGTNTLAGVHGLYLPIKGIRQVVAVLGIRPDDPHAFSDPEQLQHLETLAAEIGVTLESRHTSEIAGRAEMQMEILALAAAKDVQKPNLGHYLDEKRIVILPAGLTQSDTVKTLLTRLNLPNPTEALQAVTDRESIGSTIIESGLAIPHARLSGLNDIQAAIGISNEGPVHVWVLFLGPQEDPQRHLAFLANIASFFQVEGRIEDLRVMKTSAEILDYIHRTENM